MRTSSTAPTSLSQDRLPPDGRQIPSCYNCQHRDRVRSLTLTLHDLSPGIEYWTCGGCGFVWVTRDGHDLRTVA
jgi:hypothetical protein